MNADSPGDIVAVDFETYYDSEYSLEKMSTWNYVHDPKFDAYLVAFHGDGVSYVGHPSKADWSQLHGKLVVMHNASFDALVLARLQELGVVPPDVVPRGILCTADLSAYLGCKRDLKTAARELLGVKIEKTVRADMKGKHYADAVAAGMEDALLAYGDSDAVLCHALAVKYLAKWPESERRISVLNREAGVKGVAIDLPLMEAGMKKLRAMVSELEQELPWVEEGRPALSLTAIREHGRRVGIPVPASLAKDSPDVQEWKRLYGDEHPWVRATSDYRSVNTLLKRVESIAQGVRPDGTMPYQCKYWGANTGRFSGGGDSGGKFNMQNMPQHAMFGVDIRPMFRARPGKKFVIADFSQIEARLLLWRVGDEEFLDLIAKEGNIYVAYAKKQGRTISKGTVEYKLAKCQVLQLGYYCGWARFMETANKPPYNLGISEEEAKAAVAQYRESNPRIVNHWYQHQKWLQISVNHGDPTHEVELKSGRVLKYHKPQAALVFDEKRKRNVVEYSALGELGGTRTRIHAGILTNNEIQGMASDVLHDAWLALHDAGFRDVLWTIHDELVVEVDAGSAEESRVRIVELMRSSSPWAAGCPLDAEAIISDHYCK